MGGIFDYSIIAMASAMGPISAALETFMFVVGVWFVWKGVHGFTTQTSEKPNQGESPWSNIFWGGIFSISGPVISTAITTVGGSGTGESNPFAYIPPISASDISVYSKKVIEATMLVLKFFGYWFMLKGFLLLKELTDGAHSQKQHSPSFAGFTHILFSAILILACDKNGPIGVFLGVGVAPAGAAVSLGEKIHIAMIAIKEPVLAAFSVAGVIFGAFYTYSGIRGLSNRSSGSQQRGSVADDLRKIAGGGALSSLGGVAGVSSETLARVFS